MASMRDLLNLFEHDHPHARGEQEWFKLLFSYWINVDEAKQKIASGEILPKRVRYAAKIIGQRMFGMTPEQFGSRNYSDPNETSWSMDGPPVEYDRLSTLPIEKFDEPLLWAMFNSVEAEAIAKKRRYDGSGREFPTLIDGNHRFVRRYLDGYEGNIECDFIAMSDLKKVCYLSDMKTTLAQAEARPRRKR